METAAVMVEALDRLYHWLVLKTKRELYIPGINWVCDRHEHNLTGISMAELRRERRARDAGKPSQNLGRPV